MKFALLIYQPHPFDPKAYSEQEYNAIAAQYAEVTATPNVTPGPPLGLPEKAMTVKLDGDQVDARKGPYVSVAGAVGGFMLFEAESMDEAVALAARIPAARLGGAVEVRPCSVYW